MHWFQFRQVCVARNGDYEFLTPGPPKSTLFRPVFWRKMSKKGKVFSRIMKTRERKLYCCLWGYICLPAIQSSGDSFLKFYSESLQLKPTSKCKGVFWKPHGHHFLMENICLYRLNYPKENWSQNLCIFPFFNIPPMISPCICQIISEMTWNSSGTRNHAKHVC